MESPFGELMLARWPTRKNETLRAWDAADELLLAHLAERSVLTPPSVCSSSLKLENATRVLLLNDAFGALTCALRAWQPVNWSDSYVSHEAAAFNLINNVSDKHQAPENTSESCSVAWQRLASVETPQEVFDVVLIKIPKTTALLEDQLIRLRPQVHSNTVIIASGMVKHLQKSAFQCIERLIGPLTTSLAKKKARLIFIQLNPALPPAKNPYPTQYVAPDIGLTLSNHANVFSRERLDLGARFFLSTLSAVPNAARVMDVACGNGVLGICYQRLHPDATLYFRDESYMAMASCQENYRAVFGDPSTACFEVGDGLTGLDDASLDLVLCNPPFHQQHVIGEQIALGIFQHSKRCLTQGGELWIVANRHLPYAAKLKNLFGKVQTIVQNKKFVVLRVIKR